MSSDREKAEVETMTTIACFASLTALAFVIWAKVNDRLSEHDRYRLVRALIPAVFAGTAFLCWHDPGLVAGLLERFLGRPDG